MRGSRQGHGQALGPGGEGGGCRGVPPSPWLRASICTPQPRPTPARTTPACTAGPAAPTAPSAAAAAPRASPGRTARSVSGRSIPLCWGRARRRMELGNPGGEWGCRSKSGSITPILRHRCWWRGRWAGWAVAGGLPCPAALGMSPQTSTTACPAPARTAAPASTRSTPSSASACPATAAAAARKVGSAAPDVPPGVCRHGVGETPTGTLPSPCPFGDQHGEPGRGCRMLSASLPRVLGGRSPSLSPPSPSPRRHGGL